jgi:hypothetical protein
MRKSGKKKTTLTVKIRRVQLDVKLFVREFQDQLKQVFEEAAIEFVQVAASQVPSLTGQSRSALINIAENLGLDPGVTPDDPPISENMHLYFSLTQAGNTTERGATLSDSKINVSRSPYFLRIDLDVTSAHNGFHYFTYWDEQVWNSIDEALRSMRDHIESNFKPPEIEVIRPKLEEL